MDRTIYKKIKDISKRNIIWFLLKFKKTYSNIDYDGDYATVVTAKVLFGCMYIMRVQYFYKGKILKCSNLEKKDILPEI